VVSDYWIEGADHAGLGLGGQLLLPQPPSDIIVFWTLPLPQQRLRQQNIFCIMEHSDFLPWRQHKTLRENRPRGDFILRVRIKTQKLEKALHWENEVGKNIKPEPIYFQEIPVNGNDKVQKVRCKKGGNEPHRLRRYHVAALMIVLVS
jgi:hypothetical protein